MRMCRSVQVVVRLGIFLLLGLGLLVGGVTAQLEIVDPGPPEEIRSNDLVHITSGSSLVLLCRGNQPLHWSLGHINTDDGRVSFEDVNEDNATYSSLLTISNATVAHEGLLNCLYNDTSDQASVHLYVRLSDLQKLFASTADSEILQWTVGFEGIVPCSVTSPEVTVSLKQGSLPVPIGEGVTFDPDVGFTIANVGAKSNGHWECTASFYGKTQQALYMVHTVSSYEPVILREPRVNATDDGAVSVGSTLVLNCRSEQELHIFYNLNWTQPTDVIHSGRATIFQTKLENPRMKEFLNRLEVRNVQKRDEGTYECAVTVGKSIKTVSKRVRVFDPGYRNLQVSTETYNLTVMRGHDARWVVKVDTFPSPLVFNWEWATADGNEALVGPGRKFSAEQKGTNLLLMVKSATLENAGPYKLTIRNKVVSALKTTLNLHLTVHDKPSVTIKAKDTVGDYFLAGRGHTLECVAAGYPPPNLTWYFIPSVLEAPSGCPTKDFSPFTGATEVSQSIHGSRSTIQVEAKEHGLWMCRGVNTIDSDCNYRPMRVIDVQGSYGFGINSSETSFVEGDDNVRLICGLSKLNGSKQVEWLVRGEVVTEEEGLSVRKEESPWTWQSVLVFSRLMLSHSATYVCRVGEGKSQRNSSFPLAVQRIVPPTITSSNLNGTERTVSRVDRLRLELRCDAEGVPPPTIYWLKDGMDEALWPEEIKRTLERGGQSLLLELLTEEASGNYECQAENRGGQAVKSMSLVVEEDPVNPILAAFLVAAVIALVVLVGCLAEKAYKEWRLKVYLQSVIGKEWINGDVDKINPELNLEDQAEYLPYDDSKWEFPRAKLHLGMQLGSGAFGRVLKADAEDIIPGEKKSTVAVKMVKATADKSHIKALMSELKIMVHLGQHVNVVNLLGACTENLVKKRELLVIVEYCKYGSLLSYLHRHKHTFVDQLDHERGCIDSSIMERRPSVPSPKLNYASLTFTDVGGDGRKVASNGYRTLEELDVIAEEVKKEPDYNGKSVSTDMTYLSMYRGDYVHVDVSPISTTDLLAWGFQIARGMEYLASRKVLHGDLAARNVLLAENNVVKICDFGLAKEMYKDDEYKKKSEGGLLPVKWMAVESIYYRVFSTQSDVWSFGVVLWELFSLGGNPYPGMEADERFCQLLQGGYRMEKPSHAPSSLYDLMLECWTQDPTERPSFTDLVCRIGGLMEEGLRQHYVDLNVPYDEINRESHTYQNVHIPQSSSADNGGYLVPITPSQKCVQYVNVASVNVNVTNNDNASVATNGNGGVTNNGYVSVGNNGIVNVANNGYVSVGSNGIVNGANATNFNPLLANNTGYMVVTLPQSPTNGYVRNDVPFKTEERRQKNDSGVGSIDSSHPESPTPPLLST